MSASIRYLLDASPDWGRAKTLFPGLHLVSLPLPFALDHVNCYVLGDPDGRFSIVDTGVAGARTETLWREFLGEQRPAHVLATHYHPDHIGLAGWFGGQGASVFAHRVEIALAGQIHRLSDAEYVEHFHRWYREHGLHHVTEGDKRLRRNDYRALVVPPPAAFNGVQAGDRLSLGGRDWQVAVGPGHAPAMLMLHDERDGILLAADQVLPAISPNISLLPETPDDDPLAAYLDNLDALRALPADTRVLPAHGLPFTGLHARLDWLIDHHHARCEQLLDACARPRNAAELLEVLFPRALDTQQLAFALGELLAHLRYLQRRDQLRVEQGETQQRFLRLA